MTRLRTTPSLALALVALLTIGALGLAACSSSSISGTALSVNDDSLSNKDFQSQLQAIAANEDYVKVAMASSSGSAVSPTDESNNYSTDFTTQVLNQHVSFALASQEVAKRGLTVTDDDRASAAQVLANDLAQTTDPTTGQATGDAAAGQKILDDLGPFKDVLVNGVADILAIQNDITKNLSTDEALKTAYDAGGDTYKNQVCASAILIDATVKDPTSGQASAPTDDSFAQALTRAEAAAAQIKTPADFATVAQSSSEDSTTGAKGGDIGCNPAGSYAQSQPEIDSALGSQPVGVVGAPVKTSFGYVILLVTNRGDLTFDQAKPQLQAGVPQAMKAAFQAWLNQAAKDADVIVDPQWGSWDKDNGTVIGPNGSTSTSTSLDPNASTTTSLSPEQMQQLLGQTGGATSDSTP